MHEDHDFRVATDIPEIDIVLGGHDRRHKVANC